MTPHLHRRLNLKRTDTVKVALKGHAYVSLMNDTDYHRYCAEDMAVRRGKPVKRSPFVFAPPAAGVWHLVIEQADPRQDLMVHVQVMGE